MPTRSCPTRRHDRLASDTPPGDRGRRGAGGPVGLVDRPAGPARVCQRRRAVVLPAEQPTSHDEYSAQATWAGAVPWVTLDARWAWSTSVGRPRSRVRPARSAGSASASRCHSRVRGSAPPPRPGCPRRLRPTPPRWSCRYRTGRRRRACRQCPGTSPERASPGRSCRTQSLSSESRSASMSAPSSLHVPGGWPYVPEAPNSTVSPAGHR